MSSLGDYAVEIRDNAMNPGALAEINVRLAADYMVCADRMFVLKEAKAEEWVRIKLRESKPLSDKLTDMLYQQTPAGIEELNLAYKMKAVEKAMAAIKGLIYVRNQESINQY